MTRSRLRRAVVVPAALTVALASTGALVAPAQAAPVNGFTKEVVDGNIPGAAFAVLDDIVGDSKPEVMTSSFGLLPPGGPIPNGTVAYYTEGPPDTWTRNEIVPASEGIRFPNEIDVLDIDGDGDKDVLVPYGFFLCALFDDEGDSCGGIAWFENTPGGYVRHDIATDEDGLFYHRGILADLNGDGLKDLVSVGETFVSATTVVFPGIAGPDKFSTTPVVLAPANGGSLPTVTDVDGDGDLDVASPQYFQTGASWVWIENTPAPAPTPGPAGFGTWVPHTISVAQGKTIGLELVPGVGWIGTNHTNTTTIPADPESAVFKLVPGPDPDLPWTVTQISAPGAFVSKPGVGQAAPGVLHWGDFDGDGDNDLGVSGDGEISVFLLTQGPGGTWTTTEVDNSWGQAGGGRIADVDGNGSKEILFSSYDQKGLALYRQGQDLPPVEIPIGAIGGLTLVTLVGAGFVLHLALSARRNRTVRVRA